MADHLPPVKGTRRAKPSRSAGPAARRDELTGERKFHRTTDSNHPHPVAENVPDREFDPAEPNASWVADVTDVPTRDGWLDLAVVVDLFSRRVVDSLDMALGRRPGRSSGLVAHSDRGSQSASEHDRRRSEEERIVWSTSRRGNGWDNAPMESFFASSKSMSRHHEKYAPRAEAKASLFESIEAFDNRERRHSALGYVAPAQFEGDEYS